MSGDVRPSACKRSARSLDGLAVGASVLCLVHCLALPLVLAALPALAAVIPPDPIVHWGLLAFAIALGTVTFVRDRARSNPAVVALALIGFGCMAAGVGTFAGTSRETWATVVGVVFVASAHLLRFRWHFHC